MVKLPEPPPPDQLAAGEPDWIVVPGGTALWRIYRQAGEHPVDWRSFRHVGPLDALRFDHHLPPCRQQPRGILYAALEWETCVAEVFQEDRRIDPVTGHPALVTFRLARDVRLLDLTGRWTTRMGASMAIHTGRRDRARAWSRALYEAFPEAQGLLCCSSMDANRRTVVLYERAAGALARRPELHRPLSDPELLPLLEQAAAELGYGVGP